MADNLRARRRVATMALDVLPFGLGCSGVLARSFALARLHELADSHDTYVRRLHTPMFASAAMLAC